jgi:nucleoside-diphosphate-sugar epimerase
MRVLVTGSAGFIGRRLVRTLAAANHVVCGLDKRDAPPEAALMAANYVCDVLDGDALGRAVTEFAPDAVAHLAARTDLDEKAGLEGYAANVQGVSHLVKAIQSAPSVRRCIWTSSQLVCPVGQVPVGPMDFRPETTYGRSKVRTEEIVRAADGAGRDWIIVRPTTAWGPGMSPHYQRLLRMIRSGSYFHVGHEPLLKSYGYVDNMTHQYVALLAAPRDQIHGRVLYLADYEPIDLISWCDALQVALKAPKIRTVPRWAAKLLASAGDLINLGGFPEFPFNSFRLRNILTQYRFNLDETRAICGPIPFTADQGVDQTVTWFNRLPPSHLSH